MRRIILLLLVTAGLPVFAGHHTPGEHGDAGHIALAARIASLFDFDDMDVFLGIEGNKPLDDYIQTELTAGFIYRLHPNLKAGVFYHLNTGLRHDDDWILTDDWVWADSSTRFEHSISVELAPRWLLREMLGLDSVFSLKTAYHLNFFNFQQTVSFRPEFTYFHLVDREPVFNLSASYGAYVPLNFGRLPFYKQAAYLNMIQHVNDLVKLEYRVSYNLSTWIEGEESIANGQRYDFTDTELQFQIGLLLFP